MIYIRDKAKQYGTGKLIEGTYKKTDRCVIIDDVITSGKSVEEALVVLKDEVTIVDNFSRGRLENLSGFEEKIEFKKIDILDFDSLKNIISDSDGIFHQAALTSVP